jgi:alpha-beta hydrolase superfamily lysophospholipase
MSSILRLCQTLLTSRAEEDVPMATQIKSSFEVQEAEFQAADGTEIHYSVTRPSGAANRVVVLVHGFADHGERYRELIDHLADHGAVVYAYDQRGNGRSGGQRGHVMRYQELVDELDAFLKLVYAAEPGVERIIYAHSTGAILALTYLYDHPEAADRVILSAPCLILTFQAPAAKVFIGKVLSAVLPKVSLQAGFDPGSVSRDPAVVEANKKDELVTQAISTRFYTEVYGKAMPAALARIEELKLPTLVIQGTGDLLVSPKVADEFEKRVPNATIKRYEGGYHESHNDVQRDQVFVDLDAWLSAGD